jgi:hypothetical protein
LAWSIAVIVIAPGVNHRVERPIGDAVQLDGVKGVSAWLDPDELKHPVGTELVHRQTVGEWLGDRLDGKRALGVARLEDLAVRGGHTYSKIVGARFAQFRDVGGDMALGIAAVTVVEIVEKRLKGVGSGLGHGARIASGVPVELVPGQSDI